MPRRVAVKICGVTDPGDALLSAELGADYLGLNFWPGSPRFLGVERAREIAVAVRAAAPRVGLVGVFVNPDAGLVEETAAAVGLDLLQFSGDETAAAVRPFAARAIKALRTHDPAAAAAYADCWGLLLDAPRLGGAPGPGVAGAVAGGSAGTGAAAAGVEAPRFQDYGGTGRQWDYGAAAAILGDVEGAAGTAGDAGRAAGLGAVGALGSAAGTLGPAAGATRRATATPSPGGATAPAARRRVFLAGGLRPGNVRRVVATLRPFAVDVCSGVESAPGRKDPGLLRRLFEEVEEASDGQVDRPT